MPPRFLAIATTLIALALALKPSVSAFGNESKAQPLEVLAELNSVTLDSAKVYAVREAHIKRGPMDLYLNRGFIALMTPVNGEVTGAIFWGEGEVIVIPPNSAEKKSLAKFIHTPVLDEKVQSMYLRFTDQTAHDLLAASSKPDPDDPEQPGPIPEEWASAIRQVNSETSERILADLIGERGRPYFYARANNPNLGVFEITDDERLVEPFSVGALRTVNGRTFGDVWCSFGPSQAHSNPEVASGSPAVALSYQLQVRIGSDHSLRGRAVIELESRSTRDRILTFDFSRWLKVDKVLDEEGHALSTIGTPPEESEGPRPYDHFSVILSAPHTVGTKYHLTVEYHGNVISDVGNGVLYVGARGTWYPNIDLGLPSRYDMTFYYPSKLMLVATGSCVERKNLGAESESRWKSEGVSRIAGFNLGPYHVVERKLAGVDVAVYAAREAEGSLEAHYEAQHEDQHPHWQTLAFPP